MKISKLFSALSRTRSAVKSALNKVLSKEVKEDTIEELESQLITADLGVHTVEQIMVLFRKEKQDNFLLSLKNYLLSVSFNSYCDDQFGIVELLFTLIAFIFNVIYYFIIV